MATLRQYYETDFNNAIRVHAHFDCGGEDIEGVLLYDVSAHTAYLSCYLPGINRQYESFVGFLKILQYGRTKLHFAGKVTLPAVKQFPGELQIANKQDFDIGYRLFGDPDWRSTRDITATRRVFIYSETDLDADAIRQLQADADSLGHKLQFRSAGYVSGRARFEVPFAFVSHDSRDKEVARTIAVNLQKMLCPVWYDEFSLKVGDNLRDSIEKGLKECRKCVLVLSPHFLSNNGWTKKEFDSVFTREILEETVLVLPVWLGVTKHQVFEYSPGLLNVKGLEWGSLGEEEVCRLLHRAIMDSVDNCKDAGA
jgi:hypothetical protein